MVGRHALACIHPARGRGCVSCHARGDTPQVDAWGWKKLSPPRRSATREDGCGVDTRQSRRRPRSGRAACGAVRRIGQTTKRVCPEGVRCRKAAPNQGLLLSERFFSAMQWGRLRFLRIPHRYMNQHLAWQKCNHWDTCGRRSSTASTAWRW